MYGRIVGSFCAYRLMAKLWQTVIHLELANPMIFTFITPPELHSQKSKSTCSLAIRLFFKWICACEQFRCAIRTYLNLRAGMSESLSTLPSIL